MESVHLSNYGFMQADVPADVLTAIQLEVDAINEKSFTSNQILAGNLAREYFLLDCKDKVAEYTASVASKYAETFDYRYTRKGIKFDFYELATLWVNLQSKNEFNPPHVHDGDFSFVIWLKVPFNINDELEQPHVKNSRMPRAGMFAFQYTNAFGEIVEQAYPVDNKYEGKMFLFPSQLTHLVYPFSTSDGLRISISGNLVGYF